LWDKMTGGEKCTHNYSILSCVFSCSTNYLVLLSDAVSAGLGLDVILWVPVAVKDDDGVSRREVYTETSSTS